MSFRQILAPGMYWHKTFTIAFLECSLLKSSVIKYSKRGNPWNILAVVDVESDSKSSWILEGCKQPRVTPSKSCLQSRETQQNICTTVLHLSGHDFQKNDNTNLSTSRCTFAELAIAFHLLIQTSTFASTQYKSRSISNSAIALRQSS